MTTKPGDSRTIDVNQYTVFDTHITLDGHNIYPDKAGIISLMIDGVMRRFVFKKFAAYLSRTQISDVKQPKNKCAARTTCRIKRAVGAHRRVPIIAIGPKNRTQKFESCSEAARVLGICRTNIPHALSGKYKHVGGYTFKYA